MKVPQVLLTALSIASADQTMFGDLQELSGEWTYSVSGSQATITGYSGAGGVVSIPAVVDVIPVVKVGDTYPSILGSGNTTVYIFVIPNSVTSIEIEAFFGCTSLTSVTLPIRFKDSHSSFDLSAD